MGFRRGFSAFPLLLGIAGTCFAGQTGKPLRRFMINPAPITRKVRRNEPLPECFGTLSAKSWDTVAKAEPFEAEVCKTIRVALARDEYESAQVVLKSIEGNLANVRVRLGPLTRNDGGIDFPSNGVSLFRVSYVDTYNLWNNKQGLGWWPDPLFPIEFGDAFAVPAQQNQSILLRFHTGPDTPAGEYRGRLTVTADGFHPETLPVRLTVFDFTLPKEQHFTASVPIWGGQMEKMYPHSAAANRRTLLDLALAHRISPFPLTPDETDHALDRGMREFCVLTLPKDHVPGNLRNRAEHIARQWGARGWFDRATPYVLLGDEPSVTQWPNILGPGRIIHEIAPRFRRMDTVSLDALFAGPKRPKDPTDAYTKSFDTLGSAVDCFILAGGCYPVGKGTELAYARGLKVWWYTVADIVYIPTAGAHVRIHFWKQWKYRVPGWLHWGMTYWGGANIHGKSGKRWPAVPWDTRSSRSGDGYLVYPGRGGHGVWPSFRLETIRDGIEDYEYFSLLERLTQKLKAAHRAEFARRIQENSKLLAIDDGVVHSYREAAEDGAMLLAARSRIASAIEATRKLCVSAK